MEIYMDELTRDFPYELGGNFKYIETIDHGAFGTVIHVIEISSNKDMAIKVINKSGEKVSIINKMKEEISILRKLNHENIVKFFGFSETNNQLLIKMEYIKYGTLSQWIKKHSKITEEEASIILRHVLSAITYLHSKQICHRDIKPENIMLSKENDLHSIKIIDFGLSAQNFDYLINNDYCGTYIYMAPEQIEKKLYFISVDIWSIGILMFMLLNSGKHPFYIKGDNRKDYDQKIKTCKITFYNKVSPMAKHLICKLLEPNPSWRYNGAQAIKHPWITRNKEDEVPVTFNEILTKSNNKKIARELFNICLFMNYFSKKKKNKFIITKEYIDKCNCLDEKVKKKIIKKREKCLDVLSTDEGDDDSEDNNSIDKDFFDNQKEKEKDTYIFNVKNEQNSILYSQKKPLYNGFKNKKMYNVKSSKNINSAYKKFGTDKKRGISFKKINFQNISSINKKLNFINQNNNQKIINETNINRNNNNPNSSVQNFNMNSNNKEVISNNSNSNNNSNKMIRDRKTNKLNKIPNYYHNMERSSNNNKSGLPNIISPHRRRELNIPQFSFNEMESYNIVPIILPNIETIKNVKNLRYERIRKNIKIKKKH